MAMPPLTLTQQLIRFVIFALLVLPVVPIAMSWHATLRHPATGSRATDIGFIVLIAATLSQCLILAGLVAVDVIGPHYSSRRYATIEINLVAMTLATAVSAFVRARGRSKLVIACAWLTCSWLYLAAVSSVV